MYDPRTKHYSDSFVKFFINQMLDTLHLLDQKYKNDKDSNINAATADIHRVRRLLKHLDDQIFPLFNEKKSKFWSIFNIEKFITLKNLLEEFEFTDISFNSLIQRLGATQHSMMIAFMETLYELLSLAPVSIYDCLSFIHPNILNADVHTNRVLRKAIRSLTGASYIFSRANNEENTDTCFDFNLAIHFKKSSPIVHTYTPQVNYESGKAQCLQEIASFVENSYFHATEKGEIKNKIFNYDLLLEDYYQYELDQLSRILPGFPNMGDDFIFEDHTHLTGYELIRNIKSNIISLQQKLTSFKSKILFLTSFYCTRSFEEQFDEGNWYIQHTSFGEALVRRQPEAEVKSSESVEEDVLNGPLTKQIRQIIEQDSSLLVTEKQRMSADSKMYFHIAILNARFGLNKNLKFLEPLNHHLKTWKAGLIKELERLFIDKSNAMIAWHTTLSTQLIQLEQTFTLYSAVTTDFLKGPTDLPSLTNRCKELERWREEEVEPFIEAVNSMPLNKIKLLDQDSLPPLAQRVSTLQENCKTLYADLTQIIATTVSEINERQAFENCMKSADSTLLRDKLGHLKNQLLANQSMMLQTANELQTLQEEHDSSNWHLINNTLKQLCPPLEASPEPDLVYTSEDCQKSIETLAHQQQVSLGNLKAKIHKNNPLGLLKGLAGLTPALELLTTQLPKKKAVFSQKEKKYIPFKELDERLHLLEEKLNFDELLRRIAPFGTTIQDSSDYRNKQDNAKQKIPRKEYQAYKSQLIQDLKMVIDIIHSTQADYQQVEDCEKNLALLAAANISILDRSKQTHQLYSALIQKRQAQANEIYALESNKNTLEMFLEILTKINNLKVLIETFEKDPNHWFVGYQFNSDLLKKLQHLYQLSAEISTLYNQLIHLSSQTIVQQYNPKNIFKLILGLQKSTSQAMNAKLDQSLHPLISAITAKRDQLLEFKHALDEEPKTLQTMIGILAESDAQHTLVYEKINLLKSHNMHTDGLESSTKFKAITLNLNHLKADILDYGKGFLEQFHLILQGHKKSAINFQCEITPSCHQNNLNLIYKIMDEAGLVITSQALKQLNRNNGGFFQNKMKEIRFIQQELTSLLYKNRVLQKDIEHHIGLKQALVARCIHALDAYSLNRVHRYHYKDFARDGFIRELKNKLTHYIHSSDTKALITCINQGLLEHKGTQFKGLLSNVAISLIEFDRDQPKNVSLQPKPYLIEEAYDLLASPQYSAHQQGFKNLYKAIQTNLEGFSKQLPPKEADVLKQLGEKIIEDINCFIIRHKAMLYPKDMADFQEQLIFRLHSRDNILSKHREWSTIIGNILLFVFLIPRLMYTKTMTGRASLFFENNKAQTQIQNIENTIRNLNP
ncbi:MAG: hypothetical protein H0U75_13165 [Legionella sp.]|nr:hypothetical protein [Legionella sp.]